MARLLYTPDRGDLVHVNLSPSAGRELTRPHYCADPESKILQSSQWHGGLRADHLKNSRSLFEVRLSRGHLPAKAGVAMLSRRFSPMRFANSISASARWNSSQNVPARFLMKSQPGRSR